MFEKKHHDIERPKDLPCYHKMVHVTLIPKFENKTTNLKTTSPSKRLLAMLSPTALF